MSCIGNNRPTLRQLQEILAADITGFSTKWYELGSQLLEDFTSVNILNEIECDYPNSASKRCIKMFEKWLNQQPKTSWDQLLTALKNIDMNSAVEQIKGKLCMICVEYATCYFSLC